MRRAEYKSKAINMFNVMPDNHPLKAVVADLIFYRSVTKVMLISAIHIMEYVDASRDI